MHLSPLSEGFLAEMSTTSAPSQGCAHRDGLLRGLAVLAVFGVLMGLGFLSTDVHSAPASQTDGPMNCAMAKR